MPSKIDASMLAGSCAHVWHIKLLEQGEYHTITMPWTIYWLGEGLVWQSGASTPPPYKVSHD